MLAGLKRGRAGARARWGRRLLVLTLAALLAAGFGAWRALARIVPPLEGQLTVPGLHAPVEILFDQWGVPHVYARDSADAWFAAGYLQARERLWQMELYRRAAAGRLSELFGERTLAMDRQFRALGLRRAAAIELNATTPAARVALERHAEGVNAAVAALGRWRRPLEFQLLQIVPEPWTVLDSLACGKLMAWRLAENRHGELVRGALARHFGPAEAERLMGVWPTEAPAILDSGSSRTARAREPAQPGDGGPVRREASISRASLDLPPGLEWLAMRGGTGASNAWAVSGARTATGRPLLANDPHLTLELPAIWYDMHLVAGDLDVAGATMPGSPFVLIGHNARMAWGATVSGADVQDFYIEDVDFRRRRYLHAGSWHALGVETIEIDVRGRPAPDRSEVFSTRHGPLVATENAWDVPPIFSEATPRGSPRPLALRWDSLRSPIANGFEALNRAGTWKEFVAAVRQISGVSLSLVYADTTGNIGYAMSGALPVRLHGDGSRPVPGWSAAYEWAGSVPTEQLPAMLNPPSGQVVAANAEVDRRWRGTMTRDWRAPFRTMRIVNLLGDRSNLDIAAFREMQADVRSDAADRLLQAVDAAARSRAFERAEPEARTAIERLRLWDRRVDDRPVVSLFHAFERALWRRTFADEMDPELFAELMAYGLGERFVGIHAIIDSPDARWWDDIATLDRNETRDDIVVLAAADALMTLRARFGDEARWSWGRLHAAHFRHTMSSGGLPLRWWFNRGPIEVGGTTTTLNKTSVDTRRPYGVVDIASYRQIVDVGAWDNTRAVLTTGQSGHANSRHYFDQNALWATVQDRPFPFSRAAVERARTSRLLLVP